MIVERYPRVRRRALCSVLVLMLGLLVVTGLPLYATETENGSETCWSGAPEGSEAFADGWCWWGEEAALPSTRGEGCGPELRAHTASR